MLGRKSLSFEDVILWVSKAKQHIQDFGIGLGKNQQYGMVSYLVLIPYTPFFSICRSSVLWLSKSIVPSFWEGYQGFWWEVFDSVSGTFWSQNQVSGTQLWIFCMEFLFGSWATASYG